MYRLVMAESFDREFRKLVSRDLSLKKKFSKVLFLLAENPQNVLLRSHKVITRKYGLRWSSRVTGDLRIIWDYDNHQRLTLLVLAVGGHDGKRGVYK